MASRKVRIQTTIDRDVYEKVIKKWLPKYGQLNHLLEDALKKFEAISGKDTGELDYLSLRMMKEVGMFLMGFESGEAIVRGELGKALTENEIRFMLEWYYKKPIEKISVEEAIEFIKIGLLATNRASEVKIHWGKDVHVLVSSRHGRAWNTAICEAIKHFAKSYYDVEVSYSVFAHGFELVFSL